MNHPARRFALRLLVAGLASFFAAAVAGAQQLALTPFNASGIYALGEKVGWTATLPPGTAAPAGGYAYTIKKNNLDVIQSGRLDLASGSATIETTLDEPAMLYVEVSAPAGGKRNVVGAAVAPAKLHPSVPRPADFDAFWDSKINLLHTIPADPVLTPGESGKAGVEYATIKLNNIGGAHVYGQLARPAREGSFPAMLILLWASPPYPLQKQWVTDRAAEGWLALNVEPHDLPGDLPPAFYAALPQLIKNYQTIGNTDRDRNYFLQMYLGDYRAVDYLASRPDWDGKTLVLMGTSMGGQQSLCVAGLHPQVTHVIVHVPAGCDTNGSLHGRAAGYPNWDASNPKVMETALYFDTVNFASRIKATCLVSMGFLDDVAPPVGIWTAFNQIRGPKETVPLINAPHNNLATPEQQRAYTIRSAEWLAALVRGTEVKPAGN
jgi:cephalosporin-C deacetylase-like acetyl esterase